MGSTDRIDLLMGQSWDELERTIPAGTGSYQRTYRRLDLEKETGIRLGCTSPEESGKCLLRQEATGKIFRLSFRSGKEWILKF